MTGKTLATQPVLNDNNSRFLIGDMFRTTPGAAGVVDVLNLKEKKRIHLDE